MNEKSRRGKFLFVLSTVYEGEVGLLTSSVYALIRRLVVRGHEARVMGSPELASRVRKRGAIFIPFRLPFPPVPLAGVRFKEQLGELYAFVCSSMLTNDVLQNLEGIDVLATGLLPAALFAGELKRIPTVVLIPRYQMYKNGALADLFDRLVAPFVRQARFELGSPHFLVKLH